MDKSESENVLDTCVGHLVRELRNALKYLEHINADMHKLKGKVREVQEEDWKTLAEFRKFVSKSESVLSHLMDKKTEHNNPTDPKLMSLDACVGCLIRELRNAQAALNRLHHINDNIMSELKGKAREVQEEH